MPANALWLIKAKDPMICNYTPEKLIGFEVEVAEAFNAGRIRAPVHLSSGNEWKLIEYFRTSVQEHDYVCTAWRSHYHCLLKGVPPDVLMTSILAGKSITLNYPEQRVISSAIVGGVVPIGLGLAWAIKRQSGPERVHCFIGDMTSYTGIVHECRAYAKGHALPINFIVEDNGMSVCTPTVSAWEVGPEEARNVPLDGATRYYKYRLGWPHAGAGKRVEF